MFLLSVCLCALATNTSQTGAKKVSAGSDKTDGKVVVNQNCHFRAAAIADITAELKKQFETLKKELTLQLETINKKDNKDPWIKLNTAGPVCFGARDNRFGKVLVPSGGKLVSVKLAHLYGYVTCDKNNALFWSYWGCSPYHALKEKVDVVITTSAGRVLLPSSQFITSSTKWSRITGYNSFSPELVLSAFSNPSSVTKGQELRLWYGEDFVNSSEGDNAGMTCCDIYARII